MPRIVEAANRIVERGRHDDLIVAGGSYRELFEAQLREQRKAPA